ncbi:MAG: DUF4268 domain-containing protein [Chitinophagaceae bacterium]|nr:MAG: DUF4268 domain-containing protein [Chitinophagaceae bacterium]
MYTREEASQVRRSFWTSFGQYMKPVKGAEGDAVNWLNYKTGVKHLYFRMDADKRTASVSVEISHPDREIRERYYQQFVTLEKVLGKTTGEKWEWHPEIYDEDGRQISRIIVSIEGVNVLSREDWPAIISFFKPRIIALDVFWSAARDMFMV